MTVARLEAMFNPATRDLTPLENQRIQRIRDLSMQLAQQFYPADGHEKQQALVHLEASCMWAVKGITHGE